MNGSAGAKSVKPTARQQWVDRVEPAVKHGSSCAEVQCSYCLCSRGLTELSRRSDLAVAALPAECSYAQCNTMGSQTWCRGQPWSENTKQNGKWPNRQGLCRRRFGGMGLNPGPQILSLHSSVFLLYPCAYSLPSLQPFEIPNPEKPASWQLPSSVTAQRQRAGRF